LSSQDFNNGEYKQPVTNMHQASFVLSNPEMEPVIAAPDNLKEANLGVLAYFKPGSGLEMLRNSILGQERFDKAFRTYIDRWAFKHPQPDDFFRTIENVAGEDLGWFWRSWIMNNWTLDQGISKVKYVKGDFKKGVLITVVNLEKMPMPIVVDVKTKNGTVLRKSLPVEVWQRNTTWTFKVDTTDEIADIVLDPDNSFPDVNDENNTWNSTKNNIESSPNYDAYLGDYSSVKIPIKISMSDIDGILTLNATGQPEAPLEDKENGKFTLDEAELIIQFNETKDAFTLSISGQSFDFTKDKK
jgi:hypothetical protein